MSETQQQIPEEIQVVTIGDCEADIFDLFAQSRNPNSHLLIRGTHNRKVNYLEDKQRSGHPETKYLHQSIREIKACGSLDVQVKRNPNHEARLAKLTVRFASFEIQVPKHHSKATPRQPVRLQVILAEEENPRPGVNPISWLLLTSLDIRSFESAITCVRWYSSTCGVAAMASAVQSNLLHAALKDLPKQQIGFYLSKVFLYPLQHRTYKPLE